MYYPTSFEIDSLESLKFDGFTDGVLWNGFATPVFNRQTTKTILTAMSEAKTIQAWIYEPTSDSFGVLQNDSEEYEIYSAQKITVSGKRLKVYPLGAFMWVWSEAESPVKDENWENGLAEFIRKDEISRLAHLKTRTVYTVLEGMEGGYMPNSVSYFATKTSARDYMKESARNARNDGYTVTGSAKSGLYILDSGYSLNEYIELNETLLGELELVDSDFEGSIESIMERLNNA